VAGGAGLGGLGREGRRDRADLSRRRDQIGARAARDMKE